MERSNQIKANVERALAKTSVTVAPKDGEVSYFTNLQAFKFEPYQRHGQTQGYNQAPSYPQQAAQTVQNTQQAEQTQPMPSQGEVPSKQEGDDLPF